MKLNLGCGDDIRDGWVNVNFFPHRGIDVVCDLNQFPYPFKDKSANYILLDNVLEHLEDTVKTVFECHRILSDTGVLEIRVPYMFHNMTIYHKNFFDERSLDGLIYSMTSTNTSLVGREEQTLFKEVEPVKINRYIHFKFLFLKLMGFGKNTIVASTFKKYFGVEVNKGLTFGNKKEIVWKLRRYKNDKNPAS